MDEEEAARALAQKKPEDEQQKQLQNKQLHKVEQDLLKSEIESMVHDLEIKKTEENQKRTEGKSEGGSQRLSSRNSQSSRRNQQGRGKK